VSPHRSRTETSEAKIGEPPACRGFIVSGGWLVPAPARRAMIKFAAADLNGLVRIVKRTLRHWGRSTPARK
jgi:hypothetical protein